MASEKWLIDINALPDSATDISEDGRLFVLWDAIVEAPTVDAVEVVHGRWVMKEMMIKSPFAKNAYCSMCLEETSYAHNYCPNCGAKMDGDGNG